MSDTTTNLSIPKIPAASPDVHPNGPAEAMNAALDSIDTLVNAREETANKGQASGYASLDATGLVPIAQIPGQDVVTPAGADGAIAVKTGTVVITKLTAAALTLAAPTATTDDGKILRVISNTAAAHVVTTPANKIQDGTSTTKDTATFAAHPGASMILEAYQGLWNVLALNAVVLSEV